VPSATGAALAEVDEALRTLAGGQAVTRDEALVLLRRIESVVRDAPGGDRACEIVHHADAVAQDRLVVSSPELIDPLLDVRLALVG
jgi:hypothetical protein